MPNFQWGKDETNSIEYPSIALAFIVEAQKRFSPHHTKASSLLSACLPLSLLLSETDSPTMVVTRASAAAASSRETSTLPTAKIKKEKKQKKSSTTCSTSSFESNKSPGVRLIGSRIYDSENGKTCHQCRQKTMDFSVSCKNIADKKQCTFHYCHICLLNRYGEKAEEAAVLGCKWKCPNCRGVCNCSRCMKQRGCRPTGILFSTAKANGFSSVSNEEPAASSKIGRRKSSLDEKANSMCSSRSLKTKDNMRKSMTNKMSKTRKADGKDNFAKEKAKGAGTVEKRITRSTATLGEVPIGQKEVNVKANGNLKPHEKITRQSSNSEDIEAEDIEAKDTVNINIRSFAAEKTVGDVQLGRKAAVDIDVKVSNVEIRLPQGTNLTKVANLDFAAEDVGHALQFLEFCEAFGQVLDLKKGRSEFLLQELTCCRNSRRKYDFSLERLHIKLLSMIQKDSENGCSSLKARGRNSWLEALAKHISGCPYISKDLILNCSGLSREGYEKLESSKKLRILTFLCDEALSTSELRIWIDEKNLEFVEERKQPKKMLLHQEKSARIKLKNEVAKAILLRNGAPCSIVEHQNLVSKIKAEVSKSLHEATQSAVVRSYPILSDAYGRKFWKLKSHSCEMDVLLQDVACRDQITSEDKWFVYDVHEREKIEKYISSVKEA